MKLKFDTVVPALIVLAILAIVGVALYQVPLEMQQRKEFNAKCKLHDGIVYRTRDGSICLKKDSVIPNL